MRFFSTLVASVLGTFIALGLIVAFMFMLLFAVALSADDSPRVQSSSVLVMDLSGPIPELTPDDPFMRAFGEQQHDLPSYLSSLRMAASDDRIDMVWLRMRGMQANWTAMHELREALEEFKETSGKPIYASSDDHAMQEADYFIASVADSVFASPEAPFLYNGFVITSQFFQGTLEMLNIEPDIVRAGQYKSATEQFTRSDLSPEDREQLSSILETNETRFMETVSTARNRSVEELRSLADEGVLSASRAFEAGLIDELLYPDEVRDRIKSRLGLDADDDITTISHGRYRRVPASEAGIEQGRDNEVAIVYANGAIISGRSDNNPFGGATTVGSQTFREAMASVRDNDRVKAVVVRISSPGGSAAASDDMWRAMQLTGESKPVLVSMGNVAASGGYWLATGAEHIVASPHTITGSIGVFSMIFDASGFFNDKLGITFDQVQTSPMADIFSGLSTLSPAERQLLEESTQRTYDRFLQRVSENRNQDVASVDSVAQGRIWSGQDALHAGLVDELGGLRVAVERAVERAGLEEGTWRTRVYPRPKTFLEELTTSFADQARATVLRMQSSPTQRAILDHQQKLEDLERTHGTVMARMPYDLQFN